MSWWSSSLKMVKTAGGGDGAWGLTHDLGEPIFSKGIHSPHPGVPEKPCLSFRCWGLGVMDSVGANGDSRYRGTQLLLSQTESLRMFKDVRKLRTRDGLPKNPGTESGPPPGQFPPVNTFPPA